MRVCEKKREGPEIDPDGNMLVVGQENRSHGREQRKTKGSELRPMADRPRPWVGCRHTNRVGEWSRMDDEKQQAAAAEPTAPAEAAEGDKDYSFDRDVWVTGERFTASMTPEAFAKFVKALDAEK